MWDKNILAAIDAADDLHIAPLHPDGATHGTPTWIWSVVVDGRLYVRAWNGPRGKWYRAAIAPKAGMIRAAGSDFNVRFEPADAALTPAISAAYESKYAGSSYLPPMVAEGPASACVEILPA
ncbi:hypothetical protein AY488_00790 [Corynebacterium belfantii]|uniref:DUF2255 family protein n=1 Tax=Corynebacterium diphtheriae TaxID=1717 RepID=UPI000B4A9A94|nr:DUF2255 family protein [Corynebacterium diphtheriae]OWM97648.1 hypothetical protein AY473_00175 [Corynebacterium diphtheriae bv. mitis]OWN25065.1 hypothetical protein AY486_01700 [Corynebacterium diphtheriae bv. mitis]OWN38159.1 hypothetical protein AY488_00790 [Corynebacterium belfantii]OWO29940.1 hypothetical protein AY536_07155 [Corynebacterium diphtheriae bv. mitis]